MTADLMVRGINPSGLSFHDVACYVSHKLRVMRSSDPWGRDGD